MADIQILSPDCDDDGDGRRGKRGKRGKRGHRGSSGEGGGEGGLLKFSGVAGAAIEGLLVSYLADTGIGVGVVPIIDVAISYPVAIERSLRNLSTNLLEAVTGAGATLVIELLKNGVPVPGFVTTYTEGQSGIHSAVAGPVVYAVGDTFDLRITSNFLAVAVDVSATVGVE